MNTQDKNAVLCGFVAVGSIAATYIVMKDIQKHQLHELRQKALEDVNLRTAIINWIITHRNELPEDEFVAQLQERLDFVKTISYNLIQDY